MSVDSETRRRNPRPSQEGVALIVAIATIAILAVMLADMHESTGTAFAVSTAQRDALQAEYLAKSATNLTRLLISQERTIRQFVNPLYQAATRRPAPQLPVWKFANEILAPFCTPEDKRGTLLELGIDFGNAEGFDGIPGECSVVAVSENGKINLNDPLFAGGNQAKSGVAMQLFSLTGGYQPGGAYDALFSGEDADGNLTTRLDVVSALIDWWDRDTQQTDFDPGSSTIRDIGSEDDTIYQLYDDPYRIKNAPFDSIQELRLVRGFSDDFWSTFIEPVPNDPEARIATVYASGLVNVNEATPQVLLAKLCSIAGEITLCTDPLEGAKFTQLLSTVRVLIPIPLFSRSGDFLNFIEGKGSGSDLYPMLLGYLGEGNPLMFTPVVVPPDRRRELTRAFATSAQMFMIQAKGLVGRAEVTTTSVVNFHSRWVPPPPNAGSMPGLGVFHYYRVD